jgi:hypothetical protein
MNSLQWGVDNRIHGAGSVSGGTLRRAPGRFVESWVRSGGGNLESRPIELGGRNFSFDPRTLDLVSETGGGQHGMTSDDAGRVFVCSNSDHLQWVAYDAESIPSHPFHSLPSPRLSIAVDGPAAEVFRRSPDEPWRVLRTRWRVAGLVEGPVEGGGRPSGYFTGATGVTVHRGDLAGDAAGVVAPASGEGIYYAMYGGELAAHAVEKLLHTGEVKSLLYARKEFMRAHRTVFTVLGIMQWFWYSSEKRRERFVKICEDRDVQQLTFESYMNKQLVRKKPMAHVRIFFKDMAHLLGLAKV